MWMRLKLMAPFQRPRAPRRFGADSPPPLPLDFLAMAALHVDERGFARHRGLADLLVHRRAPLPLRHDEILPAAAVERAVDRLDDRDVYQPFLARRFRRAPRTHGCREVDELGCELVALREGLAPAGITDAQLVGEAFGIFERGIDRDAAL